MKAIPGSVYVFARILNHSSISIDGGVTVLCLPTFAQPFQICVSTPFPAVFLPCVRDQGHTSVFLFILTVRVRRFFTFVFSFICKLLISNGQPLRRMADFDCLSTSLSPSVFGRIWPPSLMLSRSCAPHAALPAPPVRTPPALPHI